jgi:hypothetical protein
MLAPLGFYLLIMLIACKMILLICWAYDTARAEIEAGRSRPADSEFVPDSIPHEWRQYIASIDHLGLAEEKYHAA